MVSLGQVVKAGSTDFEVDEASSADSVGEGRIYMRGHGIEKAGFHIYMHRCTDLCEASD